MVQSVAWVKRLDNIASTSGGPQEAKGDRSHGDHGDRRAIGSLCWTERPLAPLKHRLRSRLKGLLLLMFGVIVPAGGGVGHRHGHGLLFLPEGMGDTLKAATKARNINLPRSYQFQPPDPEKGGEA